MPIIKVYNKRLTDEGRRAASSAAAISGDKEMTGTRPVKYIVKKVRHLNKIKKAQKFMMKARQERVLLVEVTEKLQSYSLTCYVGTESNEIKHLAFRDLMLR